MGRIRTVKPDLFVHEELFQDEIDTSLPLRIAFIGLFTQCCRDGRFKWRVRPLKLAILPYDDDVDFSAVLDALWTRGYVSKYKVDLEFYGFIPTWKRHQHINNREMKSRLPKPSDNSIVYPRVEDTKETRLQGKGREGKGMEGISTTFSPKKPRVKKNKYLPGFESWWKKWMECPVHNQLGGSGQNSSKKDAAKAWPGDQYEARVSKASINYLTSCRNTDTKTKYAHRFLREWEDWENREPAAPVSPLAKPMVRTAAGRAMLLSVEAKKREDALENGSDQNETIRSVGPGQ